MVATMIPWLHFAGGDNLFFKSWHPSSHGAIAGACIALVVLAIFERWIFGIRGVLEMHWRRRTLAMTTARYRNSHIDSSVAAIQAKEDKTLDVAEVHVNSLDTKPSGQESTPVSRSHRHLPPFIPSHDLPRGAMFAFQALLTYILMLAVMTFQAAYLISIVLGLGVGEMLFGRMGSAQHSH